MKCPFNSLAVMLTVLALILGAWAQGLAQSRPHAAELIAVEICAEGGSYEILLDSRGLNSTTNSSGAWRAKLSIASISSRPASGFSAR